MVPMATYYRPFEPGLNLDFDTGTAAGGWLCLGVAMPAIIHCRYTYTKGSTPLTAAAQGPSLNAPEAFEVVAQGDADGDGVYATYSIVGTVGPNGDITLVPYEANPQE